MRLTLPSRRGLVQWRGIVQRHPRSTTLHRGVASVFVSVLVEVSFVQSHPRSTTFQRGVAGSFRELQLQPRSHSKTSFQSQAEVVSIGPKVTTRGAVVFLGFSMAVHVSSSDRKSVV